TTDRRPYPITMSRTQRLIPALLLAIVLAGSAEAKRGYSRVQHNIQEEARILVEAGQWAEAYRIYKRLVSVDTTFAETYYGMGLCEVNMPDKRERSVERFEVAARHGSVEGIYQLARARHGQERFSEAITLFEQYRHETGREVPNAEVGRLVESAQKARHATSDPKRLRIRNLGAAINSPAHDYCPLVTADGSRMYFTSRRPGTMGGLKDESGQYYEDIYGSTRTDEVWGRAMNIQAPVNTSMQ